MDVPPPRTLSRRLGLLTLVVTVMAWTMMSCASTPNRNQINPPTAYVSPNMDFTQISSLGVFPLFPSGNGVQEEALAEQLVSALTGEIQGRQSQWRIVNYRDALDCINQGNLGTGYKNLQADFNTFGGPGSQFVMTEGSRDFLDGFRTACAVDAVMIGAYSLATVRVPEKTAVVFNVLRDYDTLAVNLALYYIPARQNWWTATIRRQGDKDEIVAEIASSLGAFLGRGTLRQLVP